MGFWKGVGKAGLSVGGGLAKLGGGFAEGVGKTVGYGGHRVLNHAINNPMKTALFAGGVAAAGYGLADLDNRSDKASVAGKAALGAVAATAIPGAAGAGMVGLAGAVGAAGVGAGALMSLGKAAIATPKEPISFNNLSDLKFSKTGAALLIGGAAVEGFGKAAKKYEQIRMGQNDGMLRKQTPIIPQNQQPSYANNGGATGDLVFSMYNNR